MMVKLYADLVEKNMYTLDPEEAAAGTKKLVPDVIYQGANLQDSVRAELERRAEERENKENK